jgi:sulfur relay protein TusB/DsrH
MGKYLLIESRDPFDSSDSESFTQLVQGIAERGNETVLFLVQNGVIPARKGSKYSDRISQLLKNKIKVLADNFAVKERAIGKLVEGVETVSMDQFVKLLMEPGTKAVWH